MRGATEEGKMNDLQAGEIVHDVIQKHLNRTVIETSVKKGTDRDGEPVLFVDVVIDTKKKEFSFKDALGLEDEIKKNMKGSYRNFSPW